MSFMFNPHPYDDPNAINRISYTGASQDDIISGSIPAAQALIAAASSVIEHQGRCVLSVDGYPGAPFSLFAGLLRQAAASANISVNLLTLRDTLRSPEEISSLLHAYLPTDREKDPVLLYGKLFDGNYNDLYDKEKTAALRREVSASAAALTILLGHGAASETFDNVRDLSVWMDVTPKRAILNAKQGDFVNLGDRSPRPFKEAMRRAYYVDFKLSEELRGELLKASKLDYYICADRPETLTLLTMHAFSDILSLLAQQPYRCRPVYIEGVWGGQYIKKLRNLPEEVKNVAWCFDMIPLEVSIVAEVGGLQLEFPYHTFVQKEGAAIMGAETVERFGGYFPIRFNYDDTWHSNGNMSIQVHPGEQYVKENFRDLGRQDESYYIVATGHGAKTYCGFKDDASIPEFIAKVKKSEREKTPVDHDEYVNAISSVPGMQFMLPGGTIHASGRNQVILEIGSLTMGSYTFKLYDYLRLDLDGVPRPIHSWHGERVLNDEYRSGYVSKHLVHAPVPVRSGEGYSETVVGQCEQLYFTLHREDFADRLEDNTAGIFHVLVLVDGEKVSVRSKNNPELCYHMNYLDMVIVPASIGEYEIINEGSQPVVIHKTHLK